MWGLWGCEGYMGMSEYFKVVGCWGVVLSYCGVVGPTSLEVGSCRILNNMSYFKKVGIYDAL